MSLLESNMDSRWWVFVYHQSLVANTAVTHFKPSMLQKTFFVFVIITMSLIYLIKTCLLLFKGLNILENRFDAFHMNMVKYYNKLTWIIVHSTHILKTFTCSQGSFHNVANGRCLFSGLCAIRERLTCLILFMFHSAHLNTMTPKTKMTSSFILNKNNAREWQVVTNQSILLDSNYQKITSWTLFMKQLKVACVKINFKTKVMEMKSRKVQASPSSQTSIVWVHHSLYSEWYTSNTLTSPGCQWWPGWFCLLPPAEPPKVGSHSGEPEPAGRHL